MNNLYHLYEPVKNDGDAFLSYRLPNGRMVKSKASNLQVANQNSRITYVNPDSALPSSVWKGSESYVDFTLNGNDFHLVEDLQLKFKFDVKDDSVVLPPTPFWTSRLEISIGNDDKYETVYADDTFSERLGYFVSENQSEKEKDLFNTNSEYGAAPAVDVSTNNVRYAPIVSFLKSTGKFFYSGMTAAGRMRLRFYFPSSLKLSGLGSVELNNLQMVVKDLRLSKRRFDYYSSLYFNGVNYRVVSRITYEKPLSMEANSSYDVQLTPFNGSTVGLKVFIVPQDRSGMNYNTKLQPKSLQLLNENGSRITEVLPTDYIKVFVNTEHSHPESLYDKHADEYFIPFGSNIMKTVMDGEMNGLRVLSGKEMLRIESGSVSGNVSVIIKQYKIQELEIKQHKLTLKN